MDEFSHITEELEIVESNLSFRFNTERCKATEQEKVPKAEDFELFKVRRAYHFNRGTPDHVVLTIPHPECLILVNKKRKLTHEEFETGSRIECTVISQNSENELAIVNDAIENSDGHMSTVVESIEAVITTVEANASTNNTLDKHHNVKSALNVDICQNEDSQESCTGFSPVCNNILPNNELIVQMQGSSCSDECNKNICDVEKDLMDAVNYSITQQICNNAKLVNECVGIQTQTLFNEELDELCEYGSKINEKINHCTELIIPSTKEVPDAELADCNMCANFAPATGEKPVCVNSVEEQIRPEANLICDNENTQEMEKIEEPKLCDAEVRNKASKRKVAEEENLDMKAKKIKQVDVNQNLENSSLDESIIEDSNPVNVFISKKRPLEEDRPINGILNSVFEEEYSSYSTSIEIMKGIEENLNFKADLNEETIINDKLTFNQQKGECASQHQPLSSVHRQVNESETNASSQNTKELTEVTSENSIVNNNKSEENLVNRENIEAVNEEQEACSTNNQINSINKEENKENEKIVDVVAQNLVKEEHKAPIYAINGEIKKELKSEENSWTHEHPYEKMEVNFAPKLENGNKTSNCTTHSEENAYFYPNLDQEVQSIATNNYDLNNYQICRDTKENLNKEMEEIAVITMQNTPDEQCKIINHSVNGKTIADKGKREENSCFDVSMEEREHEAIDCAINEENQSLDQEFEEKGLIKLQKVKAEEKIAENSNLQMINEKIEDNSSFVHEMQNQSIASKKAAKIEENSYLLQTIDEKMKDSFCESLKMLNLTEKGCKLGEKNKIEGNFELPVHLAVKIEDLRTPDQPDFIKNEPDTEIEEKSPHNLVEDGAIAIQNVTNQPNTINNGEAGAEIVKTHENPEEIPKNMDKNQAINEEKSRVLQFPNVEMEDAAIITQNQPNSSEVPNKINEEVKDENESHSICAEITENLVTMVENAIEESPEAISHRMPGITDVINEIDIITMENEQNQLIAMKKDKINTTERVDEEIKEEKQYNSVDHGETEKREDIINNACQSLDQEIEEKPSIIIQNVENSLDSTMEDHKIINSVLDAGITPKIEEAQEDTMEKMYNAVIYTNESNKCDNMDEMDQEMEENPTKQQSTVEKEYKTEEVPVIQPNAMEKENKAVDNPANTEKTYFLQNLGLTNTAKTKHSSKDNPTAGVIMPTEEKVKTDETELEKIVIKGPLLEKTFEEALKKIQEKLMREELAIARHENSFSKPPPNPLNKNDFCDEDANVKALSHKFIGDPKVKVEVTNVLYTCNELTSPNNCDAELGDKNKIQKRFICDCEESKSVGKKNVSSRKAKLYKCDRCGYKVDQESQLRVLPYGCNVCSTMFPSRADLQRHACSGEKLAKSDEKSYKCGICNYVTFYVNQLQCHVNAHKKDKLYECKKCGHGTLREGGIAKRHLKHHRDSQQLYECDECGYITMYKDRLRLHQQIHSGKKLYKCDECAFSTAHMGYFKAHKAFHTNYIKKELPMESDTKYGCDECDYVSLQHAALLKHAKKYGHRLQVHPAEHTPVRNTNLKPYESKLARNQAERVPGKIDQNKTHADSTK